MGHQVQHFIHKGANPQPLEVLASQVINQLTKAKLIFQRAELIGEHKVILLVFEQFYLRNSSTASLTLYLTEKPEVIRADVVVSGAGVGLFNISYYADADFANEVATLLQQYDFEKVSSNV